MAVRRKDSATVDIKIRMKEPLRRKIEKSADHRGVSMNAEMVDRLEHSFVADDYLEQANDRTYGRWLAGALMLIGRVMKDAGTLAGFSAERNLAGVNDWMSSPYAFDQAVRAALLALEGLRPDGDPRPPKGGDDAAVLGERLAQAALLAVGNPESGGELGEWARPVRERIGAERIGVDPAIPAAVNALPPGAVVGRIVDTHLARGFVGRRKGNKS